MDLQMSRNGKQEVELARPPRSRLRSLNLDHDHSGPAVFQYTYICIYTVL